MYFLLKMGMSFQQSLCDRLPEGNKALNLLGTIPCENYQTSGLVFLVGC